MSNAAHILRNSSVNIIDSLKVMERKARAIRDELTDIEREILKMKEAAVECKAGAEDVQDKIKEGLSK
ncbi:hypothetical protein LCGC14_1366530 [marine sediment metagenome]|uniref:Uncharacterized protein n=1 Tax=marine sediment metagenome TaxID=412755 RepID=A0A0F9K6P8_9ZZZZ